ncbi:54S ribosomal protein yml6, mitochondrial [Pseudocercospora fuligena]|uniref:Large ribosomal subunit protein uL4m n=1 Tax=Pseudocercospora fuligena TaxID=685502 RepID=A0A8H6RQN4_9PEZI|nr:54S ribosomal protein yml6, mitochondrial [Pseudocercospora fuligena]
MASRRAAVPAKHLFNGFKAYEQPSRCFARSMATATPETPSSNPTPIPEATLSQTRNDATLESAPTKPILEYKVSIPPATPATPSYAQPFQPQPNPFAQKAQCTLYSFPSFEPTSFVSYPSTHLLLPLRKDILHRAVIFEGDAARQGSANTKWRSEIHGSNRKVRPQKGTGSARLGDKKSPMLRGGGVAFGPKPRDFSTDLPRKVYDRAWRTALSYRYRRGELMVVEDEIEISGVHESSLERYMMDILRWNKLSRDRGNDKGRNLFLTMERREGLYKALRGDGMYRQARAIEAAWVDVKDLLEGARVIVERTALETLFEEHESDLPDRSQLRNVMPELYLQEGEVLEKSEV